MFYENQKLCVHVIIYNFLEQFFVMKELYLLYYTFETYGIKYQLMQFLILFISWLDIGFNPLNGLFYRYNTSYNGLDPNVIM